MEKPKTLFPDPTMFKDLFGSEPSVSVSAPGRVNLLGEHTDYNGGFVFPTPLPYQTYIEAAPAEGLEAYAENFQEHKSRGLEVGRQGDWLDYLAGCVWALRQQGYAVPGLRAYIRSEVPMSGGLSSSAALEVATLRALRALYDLPLDDVQIARLAQQAEVAYVGVRCGIMDQMASSVGRLGYGLFLDTQSLETRLAPLPPGYRVAVVDSSVPRRLAESGYNTRRSECERACELLGVQSLRELTPTDLPRLEALPEPLNRRARHVVTENQRVLEGVAALEQGDIQRFGELMVASHRSLRDDYEVSIPELDRLVEAELRHGAVGARLTGAGFGGSTVALVEASKYEDFKKGVLQDYPRARFF
ncbi:galactokinase [Meiothermus ruber]|jgi:galactokinase|uniref:Galactokinase n=1 Tax=Meiothermus ruber (strain ATCC 35948 / DSM 1279 / VKM B-1258 / 21) TaxID=504728 RepID=D3PP17_MEIRD|nr:galactokinase [Meiothermus ruber]ADD29562.1 galactokinase [Meiothermus ruber DSM 1279]AGK04985.1 galactokinase [Meiothermus ruber DSM 1279]GAO76477.1 galactokinase [Meiothermus ruber H328]